MKTIQTLIESDHKTNGIIAFLIEGMSDFPDGEMLQQVLMQFKGRSQTMEFRDWLLKAMSTLSKAGISENSCGMYSDGKFINLCVKSSKSLDDYSSDDPFSVALNSVKEVHSGYYVFYCTTARELSGMVPVKVVLQALKSLLIGE